jgi:hypothetical protein
MPMRFDCKFFESRSYPNGETVHKCDIDLAPEAPWRCPEGCQGFVRRTDVAWSYGSLVTPQPPPEPEGLGDDPSIAALLDEAENILNEAGPGIVEELEYERNNKGFLKKMRRKANKDKRKKKK